MNGELYELVDNEGDLVEGLKSSRKKSGRLYPVAEDYEGNVMLLPSPFSLSTDRERLH